MPLAPQAGLEPATLRLTAGCSTIELLWNAIAPGDRGSTFAEFIKDGHLFEADTII